MNEKLKEALNKYEASSKDREDIKALVEVWDEELNLVLPKDPLESLFLFIERGKLFKDPSFKKIKEYIQAFVSEKLKEYGSDIEVGFDKYQEHILTFKKKQDKEKTEDKVNLRGILGLFYDFKLFFKFQECNFGNVILFKESSPRLIELGLHFEKCIFTSTFFYSLSFQKPIHFNQCEFRQEANFSNSHFYEKADFSNSQFHQRANFSETKFHQKADFSNSQFRKNANFSMTQFGNKADKGYSIQLEEASQEAKKPKANTTETHHLKLKGEIKESQENAKEDFVSFSGVIFSGAIFNGVADFRDSFFYCDAYFNRASFNHANFSKSRFYKIASFYCARSSGVFDFSFSIFDQEKGLNFVGIDPFCSFEKFEEYLNDQSQDRVEEIWGGLRQKIIDQAVAQTIQDKNIEEYLKKQFILESVLNVRDSFRRVKEILIKQANTLDAQNWNVMELYAKEVELKYEEDLQYLKHKTLEEHKKQKSNDQSIDSKNQQNQSKQGDQDRDLKGYWKRKIDQMQLYFYRSISDHHTDLLKIIGNVLNVIGLFGVLLFAYRYGWDLEKFIKAHPSNFFIDLFKWIQGKQVEQMLLLCFLYGSMIAIWFPKIIRSVLEIFSKELSWIYSCINRINSFLHRNRVRISKIIRSVLYYIFVSILLFILTSPILMGLDMRISLPLVMIFTIFLDNACYICVHRIGVFFIFSDYLDYNQH